MVKDVFSNNEYSKDNVYYSLLNPNNDGVMGILEIPKINQKLIIWHGVGKEALENGCGHIKVLDKKLEYEVDKISVVLPSDLSQLAIEKGEDLVTLVTCTPYGVNSHRLLVRGKRVNHSNDYRQIKNSYIDNSNKNKKTYISIVLIAIILIVIITIKKIVRNKSK